MSFIRAELSFKNAALYNAIIETGLTIHNWCKVYQINYNTLYGYITFRCFPKKEIMDTICDILNKSSYELFYRYRNQYELKCKNTIAFDLSEENYYKINQSSDNKKILSPSFRKDLDRVLSTLKKGEADIVRKYYLEGMTDEEIGEQYDLTQFRINQIRRKAIVKLRIPAERLTLKEYL